MCTEGTLSFENSILECARLTLLSTHLIFRQRRQLGTRYLYCRMMVQEIISFFIKSANVLYFNGTKVSTKVHSFKVYFSTSNVFRCLIPPHEQLHCLMAIIHYQPASQPNKLPSCHMGTLKALPLCTASLLCIFFTCNLLLTNQSSTYTCRGIISICPPLCHLWAMRTIL